MTTKEQDQLIKDFCRRVRSTLTGEAYINATDALFDSLALLNEQEE